MRRPMGNYGGIALNVSGECKLMRALRCRECRLSLFRSPDHHHHRRQPLAALVRPPLLLPLTSAALRERMFFHETIPVNALAFANTSFPLLAARGRTLNP